MSEAAPKDTSKPSLDMASVLGDLLQSEAAQAMLEKGETFEAEMKTALRFLQKEIARLHEKVDCVRASTERIEGAKRNKNGALDRTD